LANGDEETAHSLMADFLNRNPHSAKGHHIMSVIAEQSGQITEALKHACMAAEFDSPEKPSFMVRFADLTRVYGESLVAALDIVNKAIRLGQTSDWAFQVKAAILDNLGNEPKS
jgi:hypothetical protein